MDNITVAIPATPRSKSAHKKVAGAPAVIAVALGVALILLAVPRLVAALTAVTGQTTVATLRDGKVAPPSVQEMIEAARSLDQAHGWVGDGLYDLDRGYVLLRQAGKAENRASAGALLAAARAATVRGLSVYPVQPSVWLRLAALRAQAGDSTGAAQALRVSMLTGPVLPGVMAERVKLALSVWPAFDADTRSLVQRQLRLTWVIDPDSVAALTTEDRDAQLVRSALATLSDDDVAQFQKLHGRRP